MADNRDPELLRKAAQALDSARAAEVKAEEAERDARRLRSEADGLTAAARRLYADAQNVGFNSLAGSADNVTASSKSSAPRGTVIPPNSSAPRGAMLWNNGSPTAVGRVALAVAVIALLLGLWLWASRGDSGAVAKREAASAVAPVAKDAADGKAAADRAVALGEKNDKTLKDHGVRLDKAEATLQDLSACDPCKKKETSKPAGKRQRAKAPAVSVVVPPISDTRPPSTGGTIIRPDRVWAFFQHDSSTANPKTCYFTSQVKGQDPRCSAYEVVEPLKGESEAEWTARIARLVLGMKGFETRHIGKISTP